MKQLAGVVASIGFLVAAWIALTPISVDAPLADGRCGPPAIRVAAREHVDDPNQQVIIDRCVEAATDRVATAGAVAGAGVVGYLVVRLVGRRRTYRARLRRRRAAAAEREQDDRRRAAAAEHDRDAALRG